MINDTITSLNNIVEHYRTGQAVNMNYSLQIPSRESKVKILRFDGHRDVDK